MQMRLAAVFFLAFLTQSLCANERNGTTEREPYNIADCIVRGRPQTGTWAKYEVVVNQEVQAIPDDVPAEHHFVFMTSLIPIDGTNRWEWLEVSWAKRGADNPDYIAKLLVRRDAKVEGEKGWINSQRPAGWEKIADQQVQQLTPETVAKRPLLSLAFLPTIAHLKWVPLDESEITTKAGKFRCIGFKSESIDNAPGDFSYRFSPEAPYEIVELKLEFTNNRDKGFMQMKLAEFGNNAISALPEHSVDGLIDESAE